MKEWRVLNHLNIFYAFILTRTIDCLDRLMIKEYFKILGILDHYVSIILLILKVSFMFMERHNNGEIKKVVYFYSFMRTENYVVT